MTVRIKSTDLVKPADSTWKGILPLTELDQTGFITYTNVSYLYNYKDANKFDLFERLKASLSRILVSYHPLAGRLHWVGGGRGWRMVLRCNATGVELIEAVSDKRVSDFGDFLSCDRALFQALVPEVGYGKRPIEEIPLFLAQFTWFQCGGIGFGYAINHAACDGGGISDFLTSWAKLARGQPCYTSPYLHRGVVQHCDDKGNNTCMQVTGDPDRVVHYLARLPTLIREAASGTLEERYKETVSRNLMLTKHQVDLLKKFANSSNNGVNGGSYSTFEVIVSHVWKCVCKARGHNTEQMTVLCFLVDSRSRFLNPPLPPRYFGDMISYAVESSQAGEVVSKPLSQVCHKVKEMKKKVSEESVRSTIEFFKTQNNLMPYQVETDIKLGITGGTFFANPNLLVTSWLSLPSIQELDFGWGKQIHAGFAAEQFDGDLILVPSPTQDGSVLLCMALQVQHIQEFVKYLYQDIMPSSRQILSRF